jgi:hypothetical protein
MLMPRGKLVFAMCHDLRPSQMDNVDLVKFINLKFQNSIILPHGKSQLGHVDQFKSIKYGRLRI